MHNRPVNGSNGGDELDRDVLWQAADKLRGTVDTAEYKLLLAEVEERFAESERQTRAIREELRRIGNGAWAPPHWISS